MMTFDEYQQAASKFASYGDNPMYPLLGLAEECGEVCGKVAKFIRAHKGIDPFAAKSWVSLDKDRRESTEALAAELGDVMWMVAEVAACAGLRLEDLAKRNIAKLDDRLARGVIDGEGDTTEERLANARRSL